MGLSNFTSSNDDDQNGSGSGTGIAGPGGSGLPAMFSGQASSGIEEILVNYNERFKTASPTLFRDTVIRQALSVLIRKDKPNPMLLGGAGVGKTKIVEEIARLIAVGDPVIPSALADKVVYELPISALVAGAGVVGQLEERVTDIITFATDPKNNVILFIDEIHMLGDTHDPIYRKVAQIFKPALARGEMRLIGATTNQEVRTIEDDPAFERRFTRLIVDELTREQTVDVLMAVRPSLMKHHNFKVTVTDELVAQTATIADEYARASQHRPDSAVTLLDQALADLIVSHNSAVAQAQKNGDTAVVQALQAVPQLNLTEQKLRSVAVRLASGVAEKSVFSAADLRASLSSLRGQDEVLDELVDDLEREELGVFPRTKPVAWLLAGPSGVGKTETVKRISTELTGQKPIMLNMGEYAHDHDISKLIGAGPGYAGSDSNKELPFDTLESNPYRVILLDELEKAHPKVHQLFLTALDEGWMRMASGKIVDFSKATIIATTNAGKEHIGKPALGFTSSNQPERPSAQRLAGILKEYFAQEFIGRFRKLVAYAPIDQDVYAEILAGAYERERARIITEKPYVGANIPVLDDAALARAVMDSYLPEQGARPAETAARRLIEDALITAQRAGQAPAQPAQPASAAGFAAAPVQGAMNEDAQA